MGSLLTLNLRQTVGFCFDVYSPRVPESKLAKISLLTRPKVTLSGNDMQNKKVSDLVNEKKCL